MGSFVSWYLLAYLTRLKPTANKMLDCNNSYYYYFHIFKIHFDLSQLSHNFLQVVYCYFSHE